MLRMSKVFLCTAVTVCLGLKGMAWQCQTFACFLVLPCSMQTGSNVCCLFWLLQPEHTRLSACRDYPAEFQRQHAHSMPWRCLQGVQICCIVTAVFQWQHVESPVHELCAPVVCMPGFATSCLGCMFRQGQLLGLSVYECAVIHAQLAVLVDCILVQHGHNCFASMTCARDVHITSVV